MKFNNFKFLLIMILTSLSINTYAKTATLQATPVSSYNMPEISLAKDAIFVPTILWGAGLPTLITEYNVELQNSIIEQVRDVKSGKTPFFRGTLTQAAYASDELCKDDRTCLVWIYKHSDSTGGDAVRVTKDIKSFSDICGKKFGLQLGGPIGLAIDIERLAKCEQGNKIKFVYYKDLGLDSKTSESAVNAWINGELSAVSGITVDLNSDDAKLAGSHLLIHTGTFRSSISDHFFVTADYAENHPDKVHTFVSTLLQANEKTHKIAKQNGAEWQKLREKGAKILFEAPNDPDFITAIGEMFLYDLTMAGWTGNIQFATCETVISQKKELNCLSKLLEETGESLSNMGLINDSNMPSKIKPFKHNWEALKKGLTEKFGVEVKHFKEADVRKVVSKLAANHKLDDGFINVIAYFEANQNTFTREKYESELLEKLNVMSKASGSISTINGHADPSAYLLSKYGTSILPANFPASLKDKFQKKYGTNGLDKKIWKKILQATQNSSQRRANEMFVTVKAFIVDGNYNIALEGLVPQGVGVHSPVNGNCTYTYKGQKLSEPCFPDSSKTAKLNKRVVFSAHNVAGEIDISSGVEW